MLPEGAEPALTARLDAVLEPFVQPGRPGLSVLVQRGGQWLYQRSSGLADILRGIPLGADTVFRVGSVTKPFVATAILQQVQRGRLALHSTVGELLPAYPVQGHRITVEQLLSHTAGLPNYLELPGWAARADRELTLDELIASFSSEPLLFEPGAQFAYSNSGYVLLGAILEAVCGKPCAAVLREDIFDVLGLRDTVLEGPGSMIERQARGCVLDAAGQPVVTTCPMSQPYAAGALNSTVKDLARWACGLQDGLLLDPALLQRATQTCWLPNGRPTHYGLGWAVSRCGPHATYEHSGVIDGFQAHVLHVPAERLFVAVLNNGGWGVRPVVPALALAEAALGLPSSLGPVIAPEVAQLRAYEGVYRLDDGQVRTVWVENGRLVSQRSTGPRVVWEAIATHVFMNSDMPLQRLTFSAFDGGRPATVQLTARFILLDTATRVADVQLPTDGRGDRPNW